MDAPITYVAGFAADFAYDTVNEAITWKRVRSAREESYYAETNVPYTYGNNVGALTYWPHTEWSEPLLALKTRVEAYCRARFELLFCNRYPDAHQHLGWHADNSPSVDDARPIPVISFGAARELWFRKGRDGATEKLLLEPGSLLIMHAGMQETHEHRIPKCDRICGPRVSLTFRGLASV